MYIARNSDGVLILFSECPYRTFYTNERNSGYWHGSGWEEGLEIDKYDAYFPDLKWEDEPIKVVPMAVTDDNELKDWWMAAPSAEFVRAFVDPESAENFARNNYKDIGLKVWHCTHE